MNRATSNYMRLSRRRAHIVVGLLTAVMVALAGQGTAHAVGQQGDRTSEVPHIIDHLGLLRLLDELPSALFPNNNDWQ